ncbi:MAG: glutamate synthase [Ignavibacteria bacterium]|jgi:glutamate synthase (NADPH/NADH) large chain|nr:glutamate synthase [Ignavibacteria bacterium]
MKGSDLYGFNLFDAEKDACAIIARVKKDGTATHGNVKRTLLALENMGHRTGEIDHEGDGTGIQTDIPKQIWMARLEAEGIDPRTVYQHYFTVAHLMIRGELNSPGLKQSLEAAEAILNRNGFEVLYSKPLPVRSEALGARAKAIEPVVWSLAMIPLGRIALSWKNILTSRHEIEKELPHIHVMSMSPNSVIYKVRGDVRTLVNYYPDLKNPGFKSAIALGHGRYSTNTDSNHERAQMFSTLGHNGEINTIVRLRREAAMLGMPVVGLGSDSQDLDRLIESLMFVNNFSLMEAMEIVFPPVWSEIDSYKDEMKDIYTYYRRVLGMPAQGPAAIIARQGDEIVFSVDALGLRPLWFGETDKEYFASSEKGVIELELLHSDPTPIAPGEKRGFLLRRPISQIDSNNGALIPGKAEAFDYASLQMQILKEFRYRRRKICPVLKPERKAENENNDYALPEAATPCLRSFGWYREDEESISSMAKTGKESVGATGYDAPLAVLRNDIVNIPEFIKETVAVVTNPSIDRERESAQFSLRTFLGARPDFKKPDIYPQIMLSQPVLMDGYNDEEMASLKSLYTSDGPRVLFEDLSSEGSGMKDRMDSFIEKMIKKIEKENSSIVILSDANTYGAENSIDPFLTLGALNEKLRHIKDKDGISIRRKTSLVLHSGQIRNTHDCCAALGLGADALAPYMVWQVVRSHSEGENLKQSLKNAMDVLTSGIEKVISTMGIHDLSGYAPMFASIGLSREIVKEIGITSALDEGASFRYEDLDNQYKMRRDILSSKESRLPVENRLYIKLWKALGDSAMGRLEYSSFEDRYKKLIDKQPVTFRHIIGVKNAAEAAMDCDITTGSYDAPFYISAMSFGSQGETSFRAYAEAAYRSNIICMNGEGGEIRDIMGKYYNHRGQQIASARFGVNALMLNSSKFLEIKVGQGAKPGEGGHLPGFKVTAKIAETRHTNKGIDLISPSNNHDIYSIEDLAQLIEELKTVNPDCRVSVKIPAIPNIGPIACGVAKANADIITISGYDGGTGAARVHSLKYVGFPAELSVYEAHEALLAAGLRDHVEIWADGGVKSTDDILKLMALGANRVGAATLAMIAIGCTICRDCNTGTCHTGITAHFKTKEEALASGVERYEPRVPEESVERLTRLFDEMKMSLKEKGKNMGLSHLSEIVGKRQLLFQSAYMDKVDLSRLFIPSLYTYRQDNLNSTTVVISRPRTSLSRIIAQKIKEKVAMGARTIKYQDDLVGNIDRALGSSSAGELAKMELSGYKFEGNIDFEFEGTTVPGNGLGAFITDGMTIRVQGGGQDGVAKSAGGGKVVILKGYNHDGMLVDGSVGKCFAYGAQKGKFFVQGSADSRACIRLSGAEVVFGAMLAEPINDKLPNIASRANLKGFAFEYMTGGRVVVLGDPGPWICAGMTGGAIYCLLDEAKGLSVEALKRRLAKGARMKFMKPEASDHQVISRLLEEYLMELTRTSQAEQLKEAAKLKKVMEKVKTNFIALRCEGDPALGQEKMRAGKEYQLRR